jgi:hypothetical protein
VSRPDRRREPPYSPSPSTQFGHRKPGYAFSGVAEIATWNEDIDHSPFILFVEDFGGNLLLGQVSEPSYAETRCHVASDVERPDRP